MSTHHLVQGDGSAADSGTTELELDGHIVMGDDVCLTLPLRFIYRMSNPYVVSLEFPSESDDRPPVIWELSRELLWEGIQRPAGLGDVRLWPSRSRLGGGHLSILLKGAGDSALLEIPFSTIHTWLVSDSLTLIPLGTESRLIDWDAVLQRLRSGS
ncbi:SsgA family sporulation/cell division regulator [Streptomyces sp. NPDC008222]|uniref:SsgA family sporulation/cell division regulator n=1 Tax=Streptomyces sp. NPDC008222 TaxID=3364820 RepID=UPI0036ED6C60